MAETKVPKTIEISAKCSDRFSMSVKDENNQYIANYSGYVPSFMPNLGGYGDYVQTEIEIETGRILNWTNPKGNNEFDEILKDAGKKVPTIISISAKCSDCFSMSVKDANNQDLAYYHGYVPNFMPGPGGDYVKMDIGIEAGRILNWKNPTGHSKFTAILNGQESD